MMWMESEGGGGRVVETEKDISTFFSCFEKANTTDFRSRTAAEIYATMQHEYSNEDAIDVLSFQLENGRFVSK